MLLYFAVGFGLCLFGGFVDQPHPSYADGSTWLSHRIPLAIGIGATVAVGVVILIVIDQLARATPNVGLDELAYYPRPAGLKRCLSAMPARLVLVAGFLALGGWFVHTELVLSVVNMSAGGLVWPPERVLAAGLVAWGLLWLADCLGRPGRATIVAAGGFLLLAVLCLPDAYRILRE
jgi:hypothetical protein